MPRSSAVPVCGALFIVGTALVAAVPGRVADLWLPVGSTVACGAVAAAAACLVLRRVQSAMFFAVAALALGIWRAAVGFEAWGKPWTDAPTSEIRASGVIVAPVEQRGQTARAYVSVDRVISPESASPPPGLVLLYLPALAPVVQWDRVEVAARLDPVRPETADGARLRARGVAAVAAYPRIAVTGDGAPNGIEFALSAARRRISAAIDRTLPEPEAALLGGLLVGATSGTSEEFRRALVASGTTHIVVVSGYNVTLVAAALARLASRWRLVATLLPLGGVWLFAAVAGSGGPTLRAAIMATIGLVAIRTGRGRDALLALTLTGALLIAIDPLLVTDLSFQLSALATLGLIALQPRVAALFPWMPSAIRDPVSATIAAELPTLPILATVVHQVSIVSPLANLLVAPLIPWATIGGFLTLPIMLGAPPLASAAAWVVGIPTVAMVAIIEAAARIPVAIAGIGDVPPSLTVAYAVALLGWALAGTPEGQDLWSAAMRPAIARPAASAIGVLAIGLGLTWAPAVGGDRPLSISILDVGDGDAVLVRTPAGKSVLIDGGATPAAVLEQLGRRMGLVEHSLAIAVLTRADRERLPGATAAVQRYQPAIAFRTADSIASAAAQQWALASGTDHVVTVDAPISVALDAGVALDLFPTQATAAPSDRDPTPQRSLLVRVRRGSVSVLMAPSATAQEALRAERAGWPISANAILVPWAGPNGAVSAQLLRSVQPSVAVISVASGDHAGRPSRDTVELLADTSLFRTDLHGTVELATDGSALWVTTDRWPLGASAKRPS